MRSDSPSRQPSVGQSFSSQMDANCDRFEAAWKAGTRPSVAEFLQGVAEPARPGLFLELLLVELHWRRRLGENPTSDEYHQRFPAYRDQTEEAFARVFASPAAEHRVPAADSTLGQPCALHVRCPDCGNPIELAEEAPQIDLSCPSCGSKFSLAVGALLNDAAFSPCGTTVMTLSAAQQTEDPAGVTVAWDRQPGQVIFWDWAEGKPRFEPILTPSEPVDGAFRPDGTQAVVVCAAGQVLVVDPDTGRQIRQLTHGGPPQLPHLRPRRWIRFTPDGRRFVTLGLGAAIRVWEASSGQLCYALPHPDPVSDAVFSADGRWLASGYYQGQCARVWNAADGTPASAIRAGRTISFAGAVQSVAGVMGQASCAERSALSRWAEQKLEAIASHRVGKRPNRVEPRAIKRRPKSHKLLTKPRDEGRAELGAPPASAV